MFGEAYKYVKIFYVLICNNRPGVQRKEFEGSFKELAYLKLEAVIYFIRY